MESICIVILAAGLGKRMKSDLPKVATETLNGPMILSVVKTALTLNPQKTIVITGHKREVIESLIEKSPYRGKVTFTYQEKQLGTGHAVQCAVPALQDAPDEVLILYGDTPLISSTTLSAFQAEHKNSSATLSILTLQSDGTTAYGRIVRDTHGKVQKIVEAKDCSSEEIKIKEVNSGIYLVQKKFLLDALSALTNNNAQSEYYLTDIVEAAVKQNNPVHTYTVHDPLEVQGVNDFYDLALVNGAIMEQRTKELLQSGVKLLDPSSVFIEAGVTIGAGTVIGPNVQIRGKTTIGSRCKIEGTALIIDATIKDDAHIKFSVQIQGATIGAHAAVGPFAHIRPDSILDEEVKVGNFVEVKKSHLKKGAKASHLTYLGDATIGQDANIGAGTITCNYDGVKKSQTIIEDNVFIGSNSSLVAPVTIRKGATIGAGSVITKEIPEDSLALTRAELFVKKGWGKKK